MTGGSKGGDGGGGGGGHKGGGGGGGHTPMTGDAASRIQSAEARASGGTVESGGFAARAQVSGQGLPLCKHRLARRRQQLQASVTAAHFCVEGKSKATRPQPRFPHSFPSL
jgi:hypothetical protein